MNAILRFFFKILGWKVVGTVPEEVKKAVFAVCPHNTWIDFMLGLCTRATMHLNIGYLGKEELFRPPFGFLFRWLGGIPVHRFANKNLVESQVKTINESKDILFSIAPEGTRKDVQKLKSGFYYMALGAGIPIIRVGFDFPKKQVIMAEPFMPTGNFEEDMKTYFVPFFKTIGGFQKSWIKNYEQGNFNK